MSLRPRRCGWASSCSRIAGCRATPRSPASIAIGPENDWQDGLPRAAGADGRPLSRRTPSLYDLAWGSSFFRDGRAASLEEQALAPIEAQDEMAQPLDALVARLEAVAFYRGLFEDAFPEAPAVTAANIARAVAAFVRTIESGETPFDRWIAGKEDALDEAARRGFRLFTTTAGCSTCHAGWRLTDDRFHDTGLPGADPGRAAVTRAARMRMRSARRACATSRAGHPTCMTARSRRCARW